MDPSDTTDATADIVEVFAIYTDDWLVHTFSGSTLKDVTRQVKSQTDIGKADVGIEFFDCAGYRLAPEFSSDGAWTSLHRTLDKPDPEAVRQRLQTWINNVTRHVQNNPEDTRQKLHDVGDNDAGSDT